MYIASLSVSFEPFFINVMETTFLSLKIFFYRPIITSYFALCSLLCFQLKYIFFTHYMYNLIERSVLPYWDQYFKGKQLLSDYTYICGCFRQSLNTLYFFRTTTIYTYLSYRWNNGLLFSLW